MSNEYAAPTKLAMYVILGKEDGQDKTRPVLVDGTGKVLLGNTNGYIGTVQVGDGTDTALVTAGGSLNTKEDSAVAILAALTAIQGITPVASFDHGSNRDVDTSAEQLTTTSIPCKSGVEVRAAYDNPGLVFFGNSDVTANTTDATDACYLRAGDSTFIPIDNANKIYVIGDVNNQKVFFNTY